MRRLAVLAFLVLFVSAGAAAAQIRSVRTDGPRPFGVLLGDVLKLTTTVDVETPFRLDRSTLPQPGPLTYSLELRSIDVTEQAAPGGGTRYLITTEYQTFYSALETGEQAIPGYTVAVSDGSRRAEAQAGKWTYLTSPLRPIQGQAGDSDQRLRPDARPAIPAVGPARDRLIAAATLAALLLVALAWSRAWPPFHTRRARPFAAAAREVARLVRRGEEGRREALLRLHRAFDAAWGKRMLGEDIGAFLRDRPAFTSHADDIRTFFAASRRAFFGRDRADVLAPDALSRFARDLARAERGA